VSIRPEWLADPDCAPPSEVFATDDIWLSAHLARQDIPIRLAGPARHAMQLAFEDAHALQHARISGQDRNAAKNACVELVTARYGVWPARG
jgi:hypothetical protein